MPMCILCEKNVPITLPNATFIEIGFDFNQDGLLNYSNFFFCFLKFVQYIVVLCRSRARRVTQFMMTVYCCEKLSSPPYTRAGREFF